MRDYTKLTAEEIQEWEEIKAKEVKRDVNGNSIGLRLSLSHQYPKAVRHYLSYFPNNHVDALSLRRDLDVLKKKLEAFTTIIQDPSTTERDVLNFINQNDALFIIGAILKNNYRFGHHNLYAFSEVMLFPDYKVDFLLIGKNSGGHEFVFVELENVYENITKSKGHLGSTVRKGVEQIEDWDNWLDANFNILSKFFEKKASSINPLPHEFRDFDRTRMHFCVVAGRRDDYDSVTYRQRRKKARENNILLLHYDNLIECAEDFLRDPNF